MGYTTTTTTTTWYKPVKYHRPDLHENIEPAPMPKPMDKYNVYYKQEPFTSTTYKYEPYYEKKYEPPPTMGNLPEYVSNKYDAYHNPKIPYREVKQEGYERTQPYQHVFPKYYTTPYYEPYKKPYKPEEPYKKEEPYKQEEPYKKEEPYKQEEAKEDPYNTDDSNESDPYKSSEGSEMEY